ncbi:unnamed protein product [Rangifer tarandus platyrhynchus]|uniref:Uncharacterized protein n=1 Tax=Rangifer tarandus platyrhynchus TaxID=3082113 RepID=A0ABN8Z560_RANTA|nr:unnamed protein product [Rangifer tarandus platyrhynchus]
MRQGGRRVAASPPDAPRCPPGPALPATSPALPAGRVTARRSAQPAWPRPPRRGSAPVYKPRPAWAALAWRGGAWGGVCARGRGVGRARAGWSITLADTRMLGLRPKACPS